MKKMFLSCFVLFAVLSLFCDDENSDTLSATDNITTSAVIGTWQGGVQLAQKITITMDIPDENTYRFVVDKDDVDNFRHEGTWVMSGTDAVFSADSCFVLDTLRTPPSLVPLDTCGGNIEISTDLLDNGVWTISVEEIAPLMEAILGMDPTPFYGISVQMQKQP